MTFKLSKKESDAMDKIKAKLDAEAKPKASDRVEMPAALLRDCPEDHEVQEHFYDVPKLMQSRVGSEAMSDGADFYIDRVKDKVGEAARKMGFDVRSKCGLDGATQEQLDELLKIKGDVQLTTLLGVAFAFANDRMEDQTGELLDFNIKQFLNAIGLTMKVAAESSSGLSDIAKLASMAGVDLDGILKKLKDKHGDPRDMTDDQREAVLVDLKAMIAEAAE